MTDDRWQLVYALYEAAAAIDDPSRRQFVESAAPDSEIAGRVLQLLDELTEATSGDPPIPPPSTPPPSLPAGSRLGPYEILDRIGEGGMGVVYRARDLRLDRLVAIKALLPDIAADPHARERLRREARAAAALDHPYICKIFDIGEDGGMLFLVMEFLTGVTLHQRLSEARMPLPEALRVAREVAEAIQEAHTHRILHRDLKPANIMLTEQGHIKVMDFGLAKRIADDHPRSSDHSQPDPGSELTVPGLLLGTPAYMSPEQIRGLALDARSDVFSFGAILAEMLSGQNPFRRPSMAETLSAVLRDSPDFGRDMQGDTTVRGLVIMARRMLAKDAAERYASIGDVRADLSRLGAASDSAAIPHATKPASRTTPFGRAAELRRLERQLDEALAGRGSLVLISGEPGIGKTHLASALLDAARQRGALTLTGHCYEMNGSPPYVPFVEMLEHCARTLPRDSFRHALGSDAPEVARLMPELRQAFSDVPPTLTLPPEQQRRFLLNACRSFVERLARLTPVVAVFEDLHWADEPTLLLLQHLSQAVAALPMLIVATGRETDLEAAGPWARMLASLRRHNLGTRVLLRRLPMAGVEQMLTVLSGRPPPPSLSRVIFEGTDGNPFFVEEVFRHLAEEGTLFDEHGVFNQGLPGRQVEVPETVRLVLERRLERLGDDTRRLLTTAAVLGRAFSLDFLEALENAPPDAVLEALEEAERAHLVETVGKGRQTRYRFVHELLRQVLSDSLSAPRRQRLHARVADAIERVYAPALDPHIPALAHHLFHAGSCVDRDKSIHFLAEAAARASLATAHDDALTHLDNAIALLDGESTTRAAGLITRRAEALLSLSRNAEAVQEYERALALYDALGDHQRYTETCIRLHVLHTWATQFKEVESVIERLASRASGAPAVLRSTVLAMQAHSASTAGDTDRSLTLLDELHEISEHELPRSVVAFIADQEMFARYGAGQMQRSETSARKATRIYEQAGDFWSMASIEMGLLWPPLLCGRPADAERQVLEAIPRAERLGSGGARSIAQWALSAVHLARGHLVDAEQAARESLALMRSARFGWTFVAEISLGGILMYRGQTGEALSVLAEAASRSAPLYGGFAEGLLAWTRTAAEMDGAGDARAAAARCLPREGASQSVGSWNAVLALTASLCLAGEREEAARLQDETEKIAAEWDCNHIGFPVRTAAGIAAACSGAWDRAEQHHRASLSRMDSVPYVTAQPIARYWYAHMLVERAGPGDIDAARALLHTSIGVSDTIGLALFAQLARRRLSQIA